MAQVCPDGRRQRGADTFAKRGEDRCLLHSRTEDLSAVAVRRDFDGDPSGCAQQFVCRRKRLGSYRHIGHCRCILGFLQALTCSSGRCIGHTGLDHRRLECDPQSVWRYSGHGVVAWRFVLCFGDRD